MNTSEAKRLKELEKENCFAIKQSRVSQAAFAALALDRSLSKQ